MRKAGVMYVKVFSDLLDSSLWAEDSDTRIVWLTILMLADQDGLVRATCPGIAHRARVSPEATATALARFESPDPNSRTPEHEGRRVERVPGGYLVLNYLTYREMTDREKQRVQARERVKAYRQRLKAGRNTNVTHSNAPLLQAEAEAEALTTTKETSPPRTASGNIPAGQADGGIVWRVWIKACRKQNLPDPARVGKDLAAAKRIAKIFNEKKIGEPTALLLFQDYLLDLDKFLANAGHPLSLFEGRINKYLQGEPDWTPAQYALVERVEREVEAAKAGKP